MDDWEGGSKGKVGGREGGNKGREGRRVQVRKRLCYAGRERLWRMGGLREGGLMKGTSEEGTGRGMDGARELGEVGSEQRRD